MKRLGKVKKILVSLYVAMIVALSFSPSVLAAGEELKTNTTLQSVVGLLSTGVGVAGGLLIVWGGVTVGISVSHHNGQDLSPGIMKIIGGAIVVASAVLFNGILG